VYNLLPVYKGKSHMVLLEHQMYCPFTVSVQRPFNDAVSPVLHKIIYVKVD
jgi:hypothetical protein